LEIGSIQDIGIAIWGNNMAKLRHPTASFGYKKRLNRLYWQNTAS